MRVIYMAHPVSGDLPGNLAKAKRWVRAIEETCPDVAVVASWITECEVWDDANPEERAARLRRDCAVVSRCDEFWLCGVVKDEPTRGMAIELAEAGQCGLEIIWLGESMTAFVHRTVTAL